MKLLARPASGFISAALRLAYRRCSLASHKQGSCDCCSLNRLRNKTMVPIPCVHGRRLLIQVGSGALPWQACGTVMERAPIRCAYYPHGFWPRGAMMERPVGIEPTMAGWKPTALPLGYGRELVPVPAYGRLIKFLPAPLSGFIHDAPKRKTLAPLNHFWERG